jgi:TetR/AcrR family transcriptional regulator, cholesterol catabolism regulator
MNDELKNILHKVRSMYMRYGIKSVTMDDVSHELGISKKTLYQYVKDKSELVTLVIDEEMEVHSKSFSNLFGSGLNAIEELVEVHKGVIKIMKEHNPSVEYDLKKYYPEQYERIISMRRERMYNNVLNNLIKGKQEGLYRSEIDEVIIAKLQLLRIENTFDNPFFSAEEMTSDKAFREMFIYHLRGIASEKGLEILKEKLKELEINNN